MYNSNQLHQGVSTVKIPKSRVQVVTAHFKMFTFSQFIIVFHLSLSLKIDLASLSKSID
jgi:hypothetical protein